MKIYCESQREENTHLTAIAERLMETEDAIEALKIIQEMSSDDIKILQSHFRFERETIELKLRQIASVESLLSTSWLEIYKNEKGRNYDGIRLFQTKR